MVVAMQVLRISYTVGSMSLPAVKVADSALTLTGSGSTSGNYVSCPSITIDLGDKGLSLLQLQQKCSLAAHDRVRGWCSHHKQYRA
jgi:hypothetical protein